MRIAFYTDPAAYDRLVADALDAREAENTLLLGVAGQLVLQPWRYPLPPVMAACSDEDGLRLAALQTPPMRLLLSTARGAAAPVAEALIAALDAHSISIPGVNGPAESASAAAEAWVRLHSGDAQVRTRLRAYVLTHVVPPRGVPGALRTAQPADIDLAVAWEAAFYQETGSMLRPADARRKVEARIAAGEFYLWDDGRPVSMAVSTRPLRRGISVGGVYTPPELRRHGYASACVAALSHLLLEQGWQYCALFTDLANPISNHIYQEIGYRPVGDYLEYDFA
ncbi:MAG: GNAT family N-acetyltransferase [Chloroflexi bacterium]|nr:GNAT family N-acetyltransferase [Chloroflexota bacterium]